MELVAGIKLDADGFLKALRDIAKSTGSLADSIEGLADQAVDKLSQTLSGAELAAKLFAKSQGEVDKQVRAAKMALLEATAKTDEHRTALKLLAAAAPELIDQVKNAQEAFDALPDSAKAATKAILDFGEETQAVEKAATTFDKKLTDFGAKLKGWGEGISKQTAPLKAFGKEGLALAADFQESMKVFEYHADASGAQMEQAAAKARALGGDLKLPGASAKTAAEALVELEKAGLSVNDTLAAAKGTMELAAISGMNHAEAANAQKNALRNFSLSAEKAGRVTDVMTSAAHLASVEVKEIASAMKVVGPEFARCRMSIGDTATALTLLAQNSIKGEKATKSLNTILATLTTPSKAAGAEMRRLGIDFKDSQGKLRPMRGLVREFSTELGKLSAKQQKASLSIIFGKDAMKASQVVLGGGTRAWDQMGKAVVKVGEATDAMGPKNEGLKGALADLSQALGELKEGALAPFLELAESGVRILTGWVKALNGLPGPVKSVAVALGGIAVGAGMVLTALGSALTGLGAFIKGCGTLSNTAKSAGASLAEGLGKAGTALQTIWKGIGDRAKALASTLRGYLAQAAAELSAKWKGLIDGAKSVAASLKGELTNAITQLTTKWRAAVSAAREFATALPQRLAAAAKAVANSLSGALTRAVTQLKTGWTSIANTARTLANTLSGTLSKAVTQLAARLSGGLSRAMAFLATRWVGLANGAKTLAAMLSGTLARAITLVGNLMTGSMARAGVLLAARWAAISSAASTLGGILTGGLVRAGALLVTSWGALTSAASAVGAALSGGLASAGTALAGIWGAISSGASAVVAALGPVGIAIAAVTAVVAALALAWQTNFLGIRDHTRELLAVVGGLLRQAGAAIGGFFQDIGRDIAAWWQEVGPLVQPALKMLTNVVRAQILPIATIIKVTAESVLSIARVWVQNLLSVIKAGLQLLNGDWRGAWRSIAEIGQRNAHLIQEILRRLAGAVPGLGRMIVLGLINGLKSMGGALATAAKGLAETIRQGVKSTLGIRSPSKVMEEQGRYAGEGLVAGLQGSQAGVGSAADALGEVVVSKTRAKLAKVGQAAKTELALFQREMQAAQAQVNEAMAGGKEKQELAARLKRLTPEHRAQVNATLEQAKQLDAAGEAAKRMEADVARLNARLAELRGDAIPVLKLEFPGLKVEALQKLLDLRKQVETEEAAQRERDKDHDGLMASSRAEATATPGKTPSQAATTTDQKTLVDRLKEGMAQLAHEQDVAAAATDVQRRAMELLGTEWKTADGEARSLAMTLAGQQLRWEGSQNALATGTQLTGDYTQTLAALREELALGADATELQRREYQWAQEDLSKLNEEDRKRLLGMREEIKLLLQRKATEAKAAQATAPGAGVKGAAGVAFITPGLAEGLAAAKQFRDEIDQQMAAARERILGVSDPMRQAFDAMLKGNEALQKALAAGAITMDGAFQTFKKGFQLDREAETVEKLRERIAGNAYAFREATGAVSIYERILNQLGVKADEVTPKIRELVKAAAEQEELTKLMNDLRQGLEGIFTEAFGKLKDGFGAFFESIVAGFEKMLQEMAIKYLTSQLVNLLMKTIGSALGAGEGLETRASGGPVAGRTPYLVGEEGPEIFVPRNAGRIIPNHQLAAAGTGGGGAVNITLNVHGVTDAGSFRRSEHQILQSLARGVDRARKR